MPPLYIVLRELCFVVPAALAALIVALVLYLAAWLASNRVAPVAAALALAVGVTTGCWLGSNAMVQVEETDTNVELVETPGTVCESLALGTGESDWDRLPWVALAALLAGLIARVSYLPDWLGWPLRAAIATLAATWAVQPFATEEARWLPAAFVVVVLLNWGLLEHLAKEWPGGTIPFALGLAALAGAVVLIHAGTGRYTDLALALAAALVGVAVVATLFRADGGGVVPGAVVFLTGLMLAGRSMTVSEVPWQSFALIAIAPLALAPTMIPWFRSWPGWKLSLARLALLLVPLAVAAALALQTGPLEF